MITAKELERELNAASFKRTSKDNNKNNVRINSYLAENYPRLFVEFHNDKNTGIVEVLKVRKRKETLEEEKRREEEAKERAEQRRKAENFYKRARTYRGREEIMASIEKKLDKSGFYAIVKASRSCVSSNSFYVEISVPEELEDKFEDITIKISDHNTIWQQMEHPETRFVDVKEIGGMKNLHARIREIINEEWGI